LRLPDKVAEQLTDAIMSDRISPGSRLPSEDELGEQLKVSRTVIREAVRSLAALELATVTAGRDVEVAVDPNRSCSNGVAFPDSTLQISLASRHGGRKIGGAA